MFYNSMFKNCIKSRCFKVVYDVCVTPGYIEETKCDHDKDDKHNYNDRENEKFECNCNKEEKREYSCNRDNKREDNKEDKKDNKNENNCCRNHNRCCCCCRCWRW